jgi:hypothetical protein
MESTSQPTYANNLDFPLLEYYTLVEKEDFDYVYPPGDDSYLMLSVLYQEVERGLVGQHDCIAEVGSGSGILLAHFYSWLRSKNVEPRIAVATDINIEACQFSQKYYRLYNLPIESVCSSILNNLRIRPSLILCNPPYIPTEKEEMNKELSRLKNVVGQINTNHRYERNRDNNLIAFSWVGGDDGLSVIWKLLNHVDWPCTMYFVLIGDNPIQKFNTRAK